MNTVRSKYRSSKICMHFPAPFRRAISAALCCCLTPLCLGQVSATSDTGSFEPGQNASAASPAPVVVLEAPRDASSTQTKKQLREAEDAYLAGAKKLDRDELDG